MKATYVRIDDQMATGICICDPVGGNSFITLCGFVDVPCEDVDGPATCHGCIEQYKAIKKLRAEIQENQ